MATTAPPPTKTVTLTIDGREVTVAASAGPAGSAPPGPERGPSP